MLPRLTRFYGPTAPTGQPWAFAPYGVVEAHINEMPRLRAQEALAELTIMAMGNGRVKKEQSDATIRAWERQAGRGKRDRAINDTQRSQRLASLGIGYVKVAKRKPSA